MKTNSELRAQARAQLHGAWGTGVGICFVYLLIIVIATVLFGIPILIVGGPLYLGLAGYFVRRVRGEQVNVGDLFDGFDRFGAAFLLYLLRGIFIFLWTLLLIIPGIVKIFSYSMAFYILGDNPGMNGCESITASRKMMNGHKGRLFGLYFSFIGWILLGILTLGIGFLWIFPYMLQAEANFYEELKKNGKPVE
ncbi:MAG: DUF975 family protein [Treponema sp.]|jgi:uncharacterized membrane protein|nr:DUF975 family protein [Treponema sp.]